MADTRSDADVLASFYRDLRHGGFALVMFNARGDLSLRDRALERSGAMREKEFLVDAIRLALTHFDEYRAFMSDWDAPAGRSLRDRLELLSLEYFDYPHDAAM